MVALQAAWDSGDRYDAALVAEKGPKLVSKIPRYMKEPERFKMPLSPWM